jgi:hypothetical protein
MDKTIFPFIGDETSVPVQACASIADLIYCKPDKGVIVVVGGEDRGGVYELATGETENGLSIFNHADNSNLQWKRIVNAGSTAGNISGQIDYPTASTYTVVLNAFEAGYVRKLSIQSDAGTCTAKIQIGGVDVTGISAVSVSSTKTTVTATATNEIAEGDKITLVLSSVAGVTNLWFSLSVL